MPVLKDFRQTKKIILEKYEGSEVEIYDSILAKDAVGVNKNEESNVFLLLSKYIKSWNFTDDQGNELPIDNNSLSLLDIQSLTQLSEAVNEFSGIKKKE